MIERPLLEAFCEISLPIADGMRRSNRLYTAGHEVSFSLALEKCVEQTVCDYHHRNYLPLFAQRALYSFSVAVSQIYTPTWRLVRLSWAQPEMEGRRSPLV